MSEISVAFRSSFQPPHQFYLRARWVRLTHFRQTLDLLHRFSYYYLRAGIAQLVEYKLPKLGAAGSIPVARSKIRSMKQPTHVSTHPDALGYGERHPPALGPHLGQSEQRFPSPGIPEVFCGGGQPGLSNRILSPLWACLSFPASLFLFLNPLPGGGE